MKSGVSFVYFSYKETYVYNRTIFSILSLLSYYAPTTTDKIIVFTDRIEPFKLYFLDNGIIEYVVLHPPDIEQMLGGYNLIHRVKIGIIDRASRLYPNNCILYTDSDTFFIKPITELLSLISSTTALMHSFDFYMNEQLQQMPQDMTRQFCYMVKNTTFLVNGDPLRIRLEDFPSWNAGVIGLHPSHFRLLSIVYQLTDQFYAQVQHHACEQFAFAYVLYTYSSLKSCEQFNFHYWPQNEKKITDEALSNSVLKRLCESSFMKQKDIIKAETKKLMKMYPTHSYTLRFKSNIAFNASNYWKGYKFALLTFIRKPWQPFIFFKDVGYHTKQMVLRLFKQ